MADLENQPADILVVDDSATSRIWSKLRLQRAGYRVQEAESAAEALTLIRQQPPDLILLDVILPDRDGYSVTRELRDDPALAVIPVILLTSLEDVGSKVQGLEAGASDFLTKPPDEAELLARVGTLLRLKRSREDLLAEKAKTELLFRVGREMSVEMDLDTLLARVLELTINSIGSSGGSIILVDERGRAMRNIFSHRGQVATVSENVWDRVVHDGLAGWVIREGQGVFLEDAREDPRWVVGKTMHFETRSVAAVPLCHESRVVGVLTLTHEETGHFGKAQLELMDSIAAQAAVVIEKARVYHREQLWARKLQFISGVANHATSILDPALLLQEVAWLIRETFDFYYIELAMLEEDSLVFGGWGFCRDRIAASSPDRLALTEETMACWVARHSEPLLVPDIREGLPHPPHNMLPGTISELIVPLRMGREVLGIMDIQSDQYGILGRDDIPLMEILASQISVALVNARLFETVEHERGRLEAILTGTADVIVATDRERRITLFNPAAERVFGLAEKDVSGQPIEEVLPYEALMEAFQRARDEARPAAPAELALADGRTLFFNVSPVADPKGERAWVCVMQDITYLKELDEMKSEFVATVSHDLRSPLTSIRGYADLLLRTAEGQKQEFIQYIKTSAEQMAELVEDLLNLGKIEAGVETVRIPCQMIELVQETVESASFQAQLRDVQLSMELPEALPPVFGDPRQLRQVLDNIVGNALKYTRPGDYVVVRALEQDGDVQLEVEDSGIGIPQDALPRLFEKFYRVSRHETESIPGTGLGLAIVKAIVDQHKGRVWVESELGEGSTFKVAFPAGD